MSDRSVNLELEEYANDRALLIHDAIAAVAETKPGDYVNLAIRACSKRVEVRCKQGVGEVWTCARSVR